jgi:hypothetical protein
MGILARGSIMCQSYHAMRYSRRKDISHKHKGILSMLISHSQREAARAHGVSQATVSYLVHSVGGSYYLAKFQEAWETQLVEQALAELAHGIDPATGLPQNQR